MSAIPPLEHIFVVSLGFEPRLPDSKSGVLNRYTIRHCVPIERLELSLLSESGSKPDVSTIPPRRLVLSSGRDSNPHTTVLQTETLPIRHLSN